MKRKWYLILFLVVPLLVIAVVLARAFWPLAPVPLVVSEETTYFTGPLNPDGTVNYVAALNQKYGADVSAEENMAVPLLEALGPGAIEEAVRAEVLAALELELPADRQYFIPLDDFLKQNETEYAYLLPPPEDEPAETESQRQIRRALKDALGDDYRQPSRLEELAREQMGQAATQPWSADQYPILADWLRANQEPLDRLVSAPRRGKFFIPMVSTATPPEFTMAVTLDPGFMADAAWLLSSRAMVKLADGDTSGAWADALTLSHLGRLMTRPLSGGIYYVGWRLRISGASAVTAIARSGDVAARQGQAMLTELKSLPPSGSVAATDALMTRLASLDLVLQVLRQKLNPAAGTGTGKLQVVWLDPNDIMRQINGVYDKLTAAGLETAERLEVYDEVGAELEQHIEGLPREGVLGKAALLLSSSQAKREYFNDALAGAILAQGLPSPDIVGSDASISLRDDLALVALALAAFRAEQGHYPSSLSELVPQYLRALPVDLFCGDALLYVSDGESCRVWSVGRDLTDDAGDEETDIVVELGGAPDGGR